MLTSEQIQAERMADTTPVHKGFAYVVLKVAFDAIQNAENWKNPINAEIPAVVFDTYNAAAEFFTGAGLEIVGRFTRADGVAMVVVHGVGYYNAVGE